MKTVVAVWRLLAAVVMTLCLMLVAWLRRPRSRLADPASLRQLAEGSLIGFAAPDGTQAWLGIPYAAPPVGDLRWCAPHPPLPWSGTRTALAFGGQAVQLAGPGAEFPGVPAGTPAGSEDGLYLNVWAPASGPDQVPRGTDRLPVMVWIHGGGNSIGSANLYTYASRLAGPERMVLVTVNYRLGVLGWFHHPALHAADASAEDRSGNYGTQDLVAALRWVQRNIAAFGGDPGRVTIFGESAGGINVMTLMLTPLARGLFHRAISQSGVLRPMSVAQASHYSDDAEPGHFASAREMVNHWLVQEGRAQDRAAAKAIQDGMEPAELRAWVRGRPVAELLRPFAGAPMGMYMAPDSIMDGHVLPAAPWLEVFADPSRYNAVPAILGSNRDEWRLFSAGPFDHYVEMRLGLWPYLRDAAAYVRDNAYYSDIWKAVQIDEPAAAIAAASEPPVYVYRFDWDEEPALPGLDLSVLLGACHGLELAFVFKAVEQPPAQLAWLFAGRARAPAVALQRAIVSYWTEFARSGAPGRGRGGDLPEWRPWRNAEGGDKLLVLDTPGDGGIRMSPQVLTIAAIKARLQADPAIADDRERCRLYARLFYFAMTADIRARYWGAQEYEALRATLGGEYPPETFRPRFITS